MWRNFNVDTKCGGVCFDKHSYTLHRLDGMNVDVKWDVAGLSEKQIQVGVKTGSLTS